jgi:hypothetical protein
MTREWEGDTLDLQFAGNQVDMKPVVPVRVIGDDGPASGPQRPLDLVDPARRMSLLQPAYLERRLRGIVGILRRQR